jgi:methionine biosynthesis protein MetW
MREDHYRNQSPGYGMGHTRRDRILALVGGSGMRILDVGCGNGALGARLREQGNWVGGIELSQSALVTARERLDAVWSFNIEQPWPQRLTDEPFDRIILAEVLEHVFDPVAVLRQARSVLAPGGSIIITTPNFLTWTNRLRFLVGAFRYQEQGMFDFGHIRWFTYQYLRETLSAAGLRIADEHHIIFPGKLTRVLKRWPSLFAWQFSVRVVPVPTP